MLLTAPAGGVRGGGHGWPPDRHGRAGALGPWAVAPRRL